MGFLRVHAEEDVNDVLLSTGLAFVVATAALLVAKRLGVVPES